jgi:hypothetical protein
MQALVDKEVVEHKSVVLWRAKNTEKVTPFDQIRLEMFFGSMVFTPDRTEREPPGTDRVLNWAAYGLYQDQSYHLISAEEVADKKKLDKNLTQARYSQTPKGKGAIRLFSKQYEASEGRKEGRYKRAATGNKRARDVLEACDNGKRPAVQQKTNKPQLGSLAAMLGGS